MLRGQWLIIHCCCVLLLRIIVAYRCSIFVPRDAAAGTTFATDLA